MALTCRTSDRNDQGAVCAQALAEEIAGRVGVVPRIVGSPTPAKIGQWDEDLQEGRGCLLEAGGQVSDALRAGLRPILTAADCSICMTTLREVGRERPDAVVLWLDAHADFHSPQSTESGYLGGMCLAAACGVWEPGLVSADPFAPGAVVMAGVRDIDPGEVPALDVQGVVRAAGTEEVLEQITDRQVFIHLDLDVLDPDVLPGSKFPVPGGLDADDLLDLFDAVADEASEIIGVEITSLGSLDHVSLIADVIAPLLDET